MLGEKIHCYTKWAMIVAVFPTYTLHEFVLITTRVQWDVNSLLVSPLGLNTLYLSAQLQRFLKTRHLIKTVTSDANSLASPSLLSESLTSFSESVVLTFPTLWSPAFDHLGTCVMLSPNLILLNFQVPFCPSTDPVLLLYPSL